MINDIRFRRLQGLPRCSANRIAPDPVNVSEPGDDMRPLNGYPIQVEIREARIDLRGGMTREKAGSFIRASATAAA